MNRSSLPTLILIATYLSIPSTAAFTYIARTPVPQLPIQILNGNFNGTETYQLLQNLTHNFQGRVVGERNDSATASWIYSWFQGLGLATTIQSFPTIDFQGQNVTGTNVYAVSPGRTNQTVILLAHHDIVPRTQQGADDNGSGTVILMELARSLTRTTHNLTYYFLSTDSEEINLGGSRYFAQHTTKQLNTTLALSIDEVGYTNAKNLLIYAYSHQTTFTDAGILLTATRIGQKLNLPTTPQILDQIGRRAGIRFFTSDSESFLAEGIQSYALADDNPIYPYTHTPQDTIDQVSQTRLDSVGFWLETLTYNLNQGIEMPKLGESYIIYSDGYTSGNQLTVNFATYAIATIAAPIWLLQRQKPQAKIFLAAGKPILTTFVILLAAATLPLTYTTLGLWPPSSSSLRDTLSLIYGGETIAIILLLSTFSKGIFNKLKLSHDATPETQNQWIAILLATTLFANLLTNPIPAILFLTLPTLLPPLSQTKHRGGDSLRLFLALLTPFPLYAVALGGVLLYGTRGAVSLLEGQIAAGGPILLQMTSIGAITISLGYSARQSLTLTS